MGRMFLLLGMIVFASEGLAVERFSLGGFYYRGQSCEQAIYNAHNACLQGLNRFVATHEVVGDADCPVRSCRCSAGVGYFQALCPAYAEYEDGKTYEARPRTITRSFRGQGHSCQDARYYALREMFLWATAFSGEVAVTGFNLAPLTGENPPSGWWQPWYDANCTCNQYGFPVATCSGSITYLHPTSND